VLFDVEDPADWEQRSNGNAYVSTINQGLDLVRRDSTPAETVRALDALERKPARGGAVALSYQNSFDDTHKHSAEWLYGSADVLLPPLYPSAPKGVHDAILRNYQAVLGEFKLSGITPLEALQAPGEPPRVSGPVEMGQLDEAGFR
jgi:hypothetical protein